MWELLWGRYGGHAMFDPYSLQHIVWCFAITVGLAALHFRHLWLWVFGIAGIWEIIEWWIADHLPNFPFVGREDFINKVIGDPISDIFGFLLGILVIQEVYAVMEKRGFGCFGERLERAEYIATKAHSGQQYGEFSYTYHLFSTCDVLEKFGFSGKERNKEKRKRSQRLILAAILHDTLEDTDLTYIELVKEFGIDIADLVFAVTNEPGVNRKERFSKTYPKIRAHPDGIILKLADRIANVIHALQSNKDILAMYQKEWNTFEKELRKSGECDAMWEYLELILGVKNER